MGFLDRAKKLAEQAIEQAKDVREKAEDALADARSRAPSAEPEAPPPDDRDPRWGTAYVPGMLGRPGWRERGLADPAAVLPIEDRDRAGVPRSTKSDIVEEPYGMGRRWTAGACSIGLFYQLYPEQQAWVPPGDNPAARALTFLGTGEQRVVLETAGLDAAAQSALSAAVNAHLA